MMCAIRCSLEHLAFHLVDIFLCVLNHLDCFLPLLHERRLRLFNLLLLNLHPAINLLLLKLEATWRHLVLLEHLFNVPSFFAFFLLEIVFTELDQL